MLQDWLKEIIKEEAEDFAEGSEKASEHSSDEESGEDSEEESDNNTAPLAIANKDNEALSEAKQANEAEFEGQLSSGNCAFDIKATTAKLKQETNAEFIRIICYTSMMRAIFVESKARVAQEVEEIRLKRNSMPQ